MSTPPLYVVIPYYQRDKQPLMRALASIANQKFVEAPHVLIIDDDSPYPAQQVVDEYFPNSTNLQIIKQKNAGASAARNTGLDLIPENVEYVAFLDSDDEWVPEHLFNAITALERHCDFYFADHKRSDWVESKFKISGFDMAQHVLIDPGRRIYSYVGDPMSQILRNHIIQTSTVVLRWKPISLLRFRKDLVLGEDELYWIEAIRCANRICFFEGIAVHMGRGVNISQNSEGSCVKDLELLAQNWYFWKKLADYISIGKDVADLRSEKIRSLSENYASAFIRCAKAKTFGSSLRILRFSVDNPAWFVGLFKVVVRYFWKNI